MTGRPHPGVDAYIAKPPAWQRSICAQLRGIVWSTDPEIAETIKRTVQPYFVLEGNVCGSWRRGTTSTCVVRPPCHTSGPAGVLMSYPSHEEDDMTGTTRIPAAEITGIKGWLIKRFARRTLGTVPTSIGVYWHHQKVLMDMASVGSKVKKWDRCDEQLKSFAHMAVASRVGCTWCLDFNYFEAHNRGLDMDKAREVPRWRESQVFSELERDVLEYAESMSETEPTVTDELVESLRAQLGEDGVLELTAVIAFANFTTRANVALGIESDGFAAACGLEPLAQPTTPRAVVGS